MFTLGEFFPFRVDPFSEEDWCAGKKRGRHKIDMFIIIKNMINLILAMFNPDMPFHCKHCSS